MLTVILRSPLPVCRHVVEAGQGSHEKHAVVPAPGRRAASGGQVLSSRPSVRELIVGGASSSLRLVVGLSCLLGLLLVSVEGFDCDLQLMPEAVHRGGGFITLAQRDL